MSERFDKITDKVNVHFDGGGHHAAPMPQYGAAMGSCGAFIVGAAVLFGLGGYALASLRHRDHGWNHGLGGGEGVGAGGAVAVAAIGQAVRDINGGQNTHVVETRGCADKILNDAKLNFAEMLNASGRILGVVTDGFCSTKALVSQVGETNIAATNCVKADVNSLKCEVELIAQKQNCIAESTNQMTAKILCNQEASALAAANAEAQMWKERACAAERHCEDRRVNHALEVIQKDLALILAKDAALPPVLPNPTAMRA
jgi:hypothetical protein